MGGDLCAIGGWTVTINGTGKFGGYLVNVYTPTGATWKIRASVFKYQAGPTKGAVVSGCQRIQMLMKNPFLFFLLDLVRVAV